MTVAVLLGFMLESIALPFLGADLVLESDLLGFDFTISGAEADFVFFVDYKLIIIKVLRTNKPKIAVFLVFLSYLTFSRISFLNF